MANFYFYKYHFEDTGQRSLFSLEDGSKVDECTLNRRFIDDIRDRYKDKPRSLNLYGTKTDRSGVESPEIYANEIKRYESDIVLLQVRNNKHKNIMPIDKEEPQQIEHYPYCWVIIDARPDSHAILVQQKRDAFQNADVVTELLTDYCKGSLNLAELGWAMKTEKRLCTGTIWDVVKTRTKNNQDRVKSLSIKIKEKRANENNEVDRALQLIIERLSAKDGEIRLTSDDGAHKLLDETKDDLRNTVDLLIENDYRMKIGFEKSGSVEYGLKAEAVYGVADAVCLEFESGAPILTTDGDGSYDLIGWLDTLMPEDKEHTYAEAERKKHGRKARK